MDHSITFATPETRRAQGAQAYDDGKGIADHSLTDAGDIKHFEFGWHSRRVERSRAAGNQARMAVAA